MEHWRPTNLESIEEVYDKLQYTIKIPSNDPMHPIKIALVNEIVCDNEEARNEIQRQYNGIKEMAIERVNKHMAFMDREWQHAPWQLKHYLKEKENIKIKMRQSYPERNIECHIKIELLNKRIDELNWILEFNKSGLKWLVNRPIPVLFQAQI